MRSPQSKARFSGGEVVRLKAAHPEGQLAAGTMGVLWGIYDTDPPSIEVTFFDFVGEPHDVILSHDEIEIVDDSDAPHHLVEFRKELQSLEERLRRKG